MKKKAPGICNFSPADTFGIPDFLPKEIGSLKLLRQECKDKLFYYDWDLSFINETHASRPDNSGRDEIQVIFNLNQPIEWKIEGSASLDSGAHTPVVENVKMLPGEVCVFRNNNYHTAMNYSAAVSFKFKSLQMPTRYFEQLLSRYFPRERIQACKQVFLTHVTKTAITKDMYRVLSEIDSAEKYQDFAGVFVEAKMIELIALVLYGITYNKPELSPRTDTITASKSDISHVEALRQRIQFNPADEYQASQIAQALSMSESKLTRLFRSLYGVPLHKYVQTQRLERAASLLADGGMNISEAATKSGWSNMSHFSKEFQKKFGMSPKKFATGR